MTIYSYLKKLDNLGNLGVDNLLKKFKISYNTKINQIAVEKLEYLREYIVNSNKIKTKNFRKLKIERLKNIKHVKGLKHAANLPVNGQRTKTNAKTRKKFKIF